MPLNPGRDTVTFSSPAVINDRLHKFVNPVASTSFDQGGCFMQPISVNDKITDTTYSEATDKLIAPYNANTLTVKAEWLVQWSGVQYRILGAKLHRDSFTRGMHITFICKDETG